MAFVLILGAMAHQRYVLAFSQSLDESEGDFWPWLVLSGFSRQCPDLKSRVS